MYEEYIYSSYTEQELINIINNAHLDGHRKRCEQELSKRNSAQNEIIKL